MNVRQAFIISKAAKIRMKGGSRSMIEKLYLKPMSVKLSAAQNNSLEALNIEYGLNAPEAPR